jgi:hypothetical protein
MPAERIFELATKISTPLALAGFIAAVLFFVLRQLLAKNIFPVLSKTVGGAVVRQIIDRLFVLALVGMVLGFVGYLLPAPQLPNPSKKEPSSEAVQAALNDLYARHFSKLYETFPESLKDQMPYATFAENTGMTMSQFVAPPVYRHLKGKQFAAGQLFYYFDAEIDATSHLREALTYIDTGAKWSLWRFEITPSDWPADALMKPLQATSAADLIAKIHVAPIAQRQMYVDSEVAGHWIPLPGWNLQMHTVLAHRGSRTCDLALSERGTSIPIVARNVVDGCALREGQDITLIARVDLATDKRIEISSPRFWHH